MIGCRTVAFLEVDIRGRFRSERRSRSSEELEDWRVCGVLSRSELSGAGSDGGTTGFVSGAVLGSAFGTGGASGVGRVRFRILSD